MSIETVFYLEPQQPTASLHPPTTKRLSVLYSDTLPLNRNIPQKLNELILLTTAYGLSPQFPPCVAECGLLGIVQDMSRVEEVRGGLTNRTQASGSRV